MIASDAINYGLQRVSRDEHQLFAEDTAPWTVHAITSPRYARVHHHELAGRVLDLMALHPAWHLPLGYKDGEYGAERVPSGAYLTCVTRFPAIQTESIFRVFVMSSSGLPLSTTRSAQRPRSIEPN